MRTASMSDTLSITGHTKVGRGVAGAGWRTICGPRREALHARGSDIGGRHDPPRQLVIRGMESISMWRHRTKWRKRWQRWERRSLQKARAGDRTTVQQRRIFALTMPIHLEPRDEEVPAGLNLIVLRWSQNAMLIVASREMAALDHHPYWSWCRSRAAVVFFPKISTIRTLRWRLPRETKTFELTMDGPRTGEASDDCPDYARQTQWNAPCRRGPGERHGCKTQGAGMAPDHTERRRLDRHREAV